MFSTLLVDQDTLPPVSAPTPVLVASPEPSPTISDPAPSVYEDEVVVEFTGEEVHDAVVEVVEEVVEEVLDQSTNVLVDEFKLAEEFFKDTAFAIDFVLDADAPPPQAPVQPPTVPVSRKVLPPCNPHPIVFSDEESFESDDDSVSTRSLTPPPAPVKPTPKAVSKRKKPVTAPSNVKRSKKSAPTKESPVLLNVQVWQCWRNEKVDMTLTETLMTYKNLTVWFHILLTNRYMTHEIRDGKNALLCPAQYVNSHLSPSIQAICNIMGDKARKWEHAYAYLDPLGITFVEDEKMGVYFMVDLGYQLNPVFMMECIPGLYLFICQLLEEWALTGKPIRTEKQWKSVVNTSKYSYEAQPSNDPRLMAHVWQDHLKLNVEGKNLVTDYYKMIKHRDMEEKWPIVSCMYPDTPKSELDKLRLSWEDKFIMTLLRSE